MFERDCIHTALPVSNGLCRVPQGPGLGIELDEEAIEKFGVQPKPKPFPYPNLLVAIRWPSGATTYYNHAAQYWADWLGGKLPFFPRGVNLEHIANDGSKEWRELFTRAQKGAVHSAPGFLPF